MKSFCIFLFFLFPVFSQAQTQQPEWVQAMYAENPNPGIVTQLYEAFYATHPFVKNFDTQYYKRWIRSFSRPEKYDLEDPEVKAYLKASAKLIEEKDPNSAWTCIGPIDFDQDAASRSYAPGAAHVYTVERSLSNPAIFYAGTATAGLWKSVNSGNTWTLVTQNLMVNSVYAIEIDATNPNIVYFGSGGNLYKTTNGGTTWSVIGDANFQNNDHSITEIVQSPSNSNLLFLTSDYGFYRSTDGGNNFSQILTGEFQEIEFNPANPNMIYTVKVINAHTEFYRSTDNGLTFVQQTAGWPVLSQAGDHQERVEIAVTAANPNVIYANATGEANGGSGTYGIYKSSDMGVTWTFQCCGTGPAGVPSPSNINMMGWDKNGLDDGGQYYYDVALEVDPNNENKLHLGGVNHWVSLDGGVTWTCPSKWSEPELPSYVHADIHDIRYLNGELWIACDGGVFKSTDGGTNVTRSMVGMEGSDFWGFGVSPQSDVMLGGAYHNGTLLKDNNTYINGWICTGGGDGVRGFVNFGDDRLAYDDYQGRRLSGDRLQNIQGFSFDSLPNASYIVGVSSDMAWDPRNYNHIYFGRNNLLLKTEDNGVSFQTIHTFADDVAAVEIAPSNLNVIYVTTYQDWWGNKRVWRSVDGGQTFSNITPPNSLLSGELWVPYDIAVSASDENEIWLARTSQYSDYPNLNNKNVFKSTDGGTTWTNYSTATLNGEWITNIVHQAGTDGGVYIGTRRSVYYRNNAMTDWALFNANLPLSTPSTKLVPKYKTEKLINATSRSVYEVEFYEPSEPMAQIAANRFKVNCIDNVVQFVDHSVLSSQNASWSWSFPGGTPNSSTQQNPLVSYAAPGFYDVTLTVSDANGTSTQNYTQFIEFVSPTVQANLTEDFEGGASADYTFQTDNSAYNWTPRVIAHGPQCDSTEVIWVDNYAIDTQGAEAEIITPTVNLSNVSQAMLTFDYAYSQYQDSYLDGLRIDISTDCWDSYDTLFLKFGDSLETVPNHGNNWTPEDCADWSLVNGIDISAYAGQNVMIRFVAINDFGNSLFLDNINIQTNLGIVDLDELQFQVFPNPNNGSFIVRHDLSTPKMTILSLDGKLIYEGILTEATAKMDYNLPAGTYMVQLEENGIRGVKRVVVR